MGASRCSVVIVIGGGPLERPPGAGRPGHDTPFDLVIAADSGYDAALAASFAPTHLVGDLDSISDAGREHAEQHGVVLHRHPADKEATDTALAVALALDLGATELTVFGPADAGRLDHLLGSIAVLGEPRLAGCTSVTAHTAGASLHVIHPGRPQRLALTPHCTFSLLALHGDCGGVDLSGATWNLTDADLSATRSLGISNVALGPITVRSRTGVLTVVAARP
ncbi:MAG: putative thiamine pyrophosphokinae [Actinomycetota bacterium]|jgi:thiamine pyrophosphokinase